MPQLPGPRRGQEFTQNGGTAGTSTEAEAGGRAWREGVTERPKKRHVEKGSDSPHEGRRKEPKRKGEAEEGRRKEPNTAETNSRLKEPKKDLGHGSSVKRIKDPPKEPRVVVGVGLEQGTESRR